MIYTLTDHKNTRRLQAGQMVSHMKLFRKAQPTFDEFATFFIRQKNYTHQTLPLTESFCALQGLVLYIASPFTFNQSPICVSLSWKIGEIVPSEAGPTFISKLPPQLTKKRQTYKHSNLQMKSPY